MGTERTKLHRWLPALWFAISSALLALDFVTGPYVGFPILFVIPVGLAARYNGRNWGIAFALLLPLVRFGFVFLWSEPWSIEISAINLAIRQTVLLGIAILIDRAVRQSREIRRLRGILPTCCVCKKIRTNNGGWLPIETYITGHSEAQFSHTFCPECGERQYGEFWPQQSSSPEVDTNSK